MKITIDPDSGFCFGVKQAIALAEAELDAGQEVYCLGEMVHNQMEMDRLKSKGLRIISHDDLPQMKGRKVLVRAHGEPPSTFLIAEQLGISIINATCPIVGRLQEQIRKSFSSNDVDQRQIVVFGKPGHAEVVGLNGNADNKAIVVHSVDDLDEIDFSKPVHLFSQTTMDAAHYGEMAEAIEQRMGSNCAELIVQKSACRQVSGRASDLKLFAAAYDMILFVAGKNSANGAYLFSVCKDANPKSYFVTGPDDLKKEWLHQVESIGITGATSTPLWQLQAFSEMLQSL